MVSMKPDPFILKPSKVKSRYERIRGYVYVAIDVTVTLTILFLLLGLATGIVTGVARFIESFKCTLPH